MEKLKLTNNEIALIIAIRKYFRYGDVIVSVKDGKPRYIKRAWESADLERDDLT